jgi:hypothetical protein
MKRFCLILLLTGAIFPLIFGKSSDILISGTGYPTVNYQEDTINLYSLIKVTPFVVNIVPPSTGVQFYRDGIVFLSNSRTEGKMLESHTSFGTVDAYYAPVWDEELGEHEIFSATESWSVPCEAMTFNSDYSVMYYTKIPSKRESEKIIEARFQVSKNGKNNWISENKPLGFCSDKSVYTHPALSADGEKMVFASDTKGSVGGLDLFISYKEGDDWSTPINLGNLINTQGNEMYPFLDKENNLFFSSDGIKGFGGYDIFFCRYNGRGWDKPVNLTQIVNTADDDLAFTLNRLNGKSAFFSTRKTTGNKSVQLQRISFLNQKMVTGLANLSDTFKYLAQAKLLAYESQIIVDEPEPDVKKTEGAEAEKLVKEQIKEPVVPVEEIQETIEQKPEPASEELTSSPDAIMYRVQYLSSTKPMETSNIVIGGVTYQTYEYLFAGAYRQCAGEFSSPGPALELQNNMRRNGYSDAFIVAFRNDQRLTGSMLAQARAQQQETEQTEQKPVEEIQEQKPVEIINEPEQPADNNAVVFRVQFLSSSQSKGNYQITAGGITYNTFEYFYSGAYRLCAGQFRNREDANRLREALRSEGYSDSFVVAFINNQRVTDPALLR